MNIINFLEHLLIDEFQDLQDICRCVHISKIYKGHLLISLLLNIELKRLY